MYVADILSRSKDQMGGGLWCWEGATSSYKVQLLFSTTYSYLHFCHPDLLFSSVNTYFRVFRSKYFFAILKYKKEKVSRYWNITEIIKLFVLYIS